MRLRESKKIILWSDLLPQTIDWYNKIPGVKPSPGFVSNLNNYFILPLVSSGVWFSLDYLALFATETREQAKIPIKAVNNAFITEVNTPTFTYKQGFNGNAASQYLRTGFNASTNGVNTSLNNVSAGIYIRSNSSNLNFYDFGAMANASSHRFLLNAKRPADESVTALNNASSTATVGIGSTAAFFSIKRTLAANYTMNKNGVSLATVAAATNAIPNNEIYICCLNSNGIPFFYTDRQYSLFFIGSGSINQLSLYQIIQNYATIEGWQV